MDSQEPWSSSCGAKSQSNDDYNIYDFDGENSMDNEEDYNSLENAVFSRGDESKRTEMDEETLHNKFAQKLFAALHKNEDERSQNSSNEYGLSVSKEASFLQSESKIQVVNPWMDEEEDFTTYEENHEEFTATAVDMEISDEEDNLGLQKSRWNQKSLDLSSTKTVPYKSEIYDPFRKSYMDQNQLCVGSNNSGWGQKLLDSSNTKTVSDKSDIYAGYATQNPQNYKPPAENKCRWDKKSLPSNNYMDPRRNFQGAPNWSANPQQNYSLHQQIRNTPQGSQMTSKNANYIDPKRNFQGTSIVLPNPQQKYNLNQQITNTPQGSQMTSKNANLTHVELKKGQIYQRMLSNRRKEAATTVPNVPVVPTIQMGNNNLGGDTSGYLRNYVEQIYRCTPTDKVVFDRIVQQIIRNLLFGKVTLSEVISRLDPAVRKTLLDRCPALNINTGQSTIISGSVVVLKKKKNSKKDKKNKKTPVTLTQSVPPQTVAVSVKHAATALNIKTGQSTSTSISCRVRKKKKFYRKDKKNKGYTLTFRQSPPPQTVAESVKHSTTLVESSQVTQAALNGHTTTLPPIISPPNHFIPLPTPWFLKFMVKPKDLVRIPDKPLINPDVCAKLANKFNAVKIVDKTNVDRTFEVADVIDIEKKLTQTLDETISNPKIAIPKFYAMAYVDKCIWLSGEPEIKKWLKRNLKKWSLKILFHPEVSLVKQFYFFLPSKARHLLVDNRTKLQAVWSELAGNNPFVVEDGWMISLYLNKSLDPDLVTVVCHLGSQSAVESLTNKDCCVKFCDDLVKLYPGLVPMKAKEFAQQHPDVPIQRIC